MEMDETSLSSDTSEDTPEVKDQVSKREDYTVRGTYKLSILSISIPLILFFFHALCQSTPDVEFLFIFNQETSSTRISVLH